MLKRLQTHLTYANVTATLALVLALGAGSATAAQLITGADVRNNSLTTRDVRDGSLLAKDLRRGQLPATEVVIRRSPPLHYDFAPAGSTTVPNTARCEGGERVTGGGVTAPAASATLTDPTVVASQPIGASGNPPTGWTGTVRYTLTEGPAAAPAPQVWVVCASP